MALLALIQFVFLLCLAATSILVSVWFYDFFRRISSATQNKGLSTTKQESLPPFLPSETKPQVHAKIIKLQPENPASDGELAKAA